MNAVIVRKLRALVHDGRGLFQVRTQNGAFHSSEEMPEMLIALGGEGSDASLEILSQTGRQRG